MPHRLDVGVFLRDMAADIAIRFQACDERGFARTTRSNNTDKRFVTWRLHVWWVGLAARQLGLSGYQPDLLIILHKLTELLRTAQHSQGITGVDRARVGGVHLGLVVMPEQDDIEMIIVLYIADCFVDEVRS